MSNSLSIFQVSTYKKRMLRLLERVGRNIPWMKKLKPPQMIRGPTMMKLEPPQMMRGSTIEKRLSEIISNLKILGEKKIMPQEI